MQSIDPSSGRVVATFTPLTEPEVRRRLDRAAHVFETWSREAMADRAAVLQQAARVIEGRGEHLAQTITREMGKPITQARSEVSRCAQVCAFFADRAGAFLESQPVPTEAAESYVAFRPLGTVLAVMPWNFPMWQIFRYAAPALMAGNVSVLKPAPNVCGVAMEAERVLAEAGAPEGVFQTLLAPVELVGTMIHHPAVAAVTVTGSPGAGAKVAEEAGRALVKCVLELGGSDPYVVLDDADLDLAADVSVEARMDNSGQSCVAAKRLVVVERHREAFERKVTERMERYEMAPPTEDDTALGPLARADLRDELHRQVRRSVEAGARLVAGGHVPEGPGFYYPATVLTGVTPGMPAHDEELFGPVASIISVEDDEAAIRKANETVYGLGAAVFTRDRERGRRIAEQELEAGCCFVNSAVRSDPRLPFGGVKRSGYGRELSGHGLRELTNKKTVWVEPGG